MDADPPKEELSGRLLAASVIFLLVAAALRAVSALSDGWALLYASIGSGAVALTCLGAALWRNRDRL
ncbi:MAG: hypothetical protein ACOYXM_06130 [Actinomycetota bacterium]